MIRVRRVDNGLPFVRTYEIEFAASPTDAVHERLRRARRGSAVKRLERDVGTGDAWSFVSAADVAWESGDRSWAVEYEPPHETPR
jgi:hypothetical protein